MTLFGINQTGKKLNINELGQSLTGQGTMPKIDNDMTMNGSIFNKVFKNSSAKKEDSDSTDTEKLKGKGEEAKAEAEESSTKGKAWIGKLQGISEDAKETTKTSNATAQNLFKQTQAGIKTITAGKKEINTLMKENDSISTETATLEAERDSLLSNDGTGEGENSAFTLKLGGTQPQATQTPTAGSPAGGASFLNAKPTATVPQSNTNNGNPNQDKIDDLTSKIDTLYTKKTANTTATNTITKTNTTTFNRLNLAIKTAAKAGAMAKAKADKQKQQAQAGQNTAVITQGVGAVTSATGAGLLCFPATATAGAVVSAAGAGVTGVGNGISAASSASKGDLTSATNSLNQSSGQFTTMAAGIEKARGKK